MVNVEPYEYQRKTNLKEHNDLVAKINEIVDVVNQTNMETIAPRIDKLEQDVSEITAKDSVQDSDITSLKTKTAKLEQDVSGINATDSLQWNDIETVKTDIGTINPKIAKLEQDVTAIKDIDSSQSNDIKSIKAKNTEQDNTLATHATEITGITKSLVSDVALINGTTTGNMKVRVERKDAPSIDSNDYNIQKPTSVELVQGSAPAMVKAQITLSDGTVLISDDFMFTTEAIGQDVYISSFVFKNGNVAGTISADIGLSNGSTLTANNFAVPTDPNVTSAISDLQGKVATVENDVSGLKTTVSGHTTSINNIDSEVSDLQTRVTAVESDTSGLNALKATVDGHTASISALDSDVANLQIDKADVNDSNQSIVAGSISATNITKGGVNVATVNDISGKADLNNTGQTITAGTINATNINKNGVAVATTDDIPDISGKVNIAQGTANAGKVLGINSSGNVEPITIDSGGEVWEEVDLNNFPTNWVDGDRIKIQFYPIKGELSSYPTNWTTAPSGTFTFKSEINDRTDVKEYELKGDTTYYNAPIISDISNKKYNRILSLAYINTISEWNKPNSSLPLISLNYNVYNGGGCVLGFPSVTKSNISTRIYKMWRLKK